MVGKTTNEGPYPEEGSTQAMLRSVDGVVACLMDIPHLQKGRH